jgi:hypothetical protein
VGQIEVADYLQPGTYMESQHAGGSGGGARYPLPGPAPELVTGALSCEHLFSALDGCELAALGKRWRIDVFGVIENAGRRFVQLGLEGPTHHMLTMRLAPHVPVRRLGFSLVVWLAAPRDPGEIIDVE